MDKTRKVVLYGHALAVSIAGAGLQGHPGFEIVQIDPLHPDALPRLKAARPDVVLFDLAGTQNDFSVALLRNNSDLSLIGVDLKNDKMLVVTGEESRLLTLDDLLHVIELGKSRAQDDKL